MFSQTEPTPLVETPKQFLDFLDPRYHRHHLPSETLLRLCEEGLSIGSQEPQGWVFVLGFESLEVDPHGDSF